MVLAWLLVAGCGHPGGSSRALEQLERLAFVPPVEGVLAVESESGLRFPSFAIREPLLVGRFEVTRAEWLDWLDEGEAPSAVRARSRADEWSPDEASWPATFMTFDEAARFAAARGMRLPTAEEWVCIATGPRKHPFPWGARWQDSVANTLELGLGRPCAVGTFRSGQTPSGVADLLGNVWEWASGRLPGVEAPAADQRATVLGGSYATWARSRRIYREGRFLAEVRDPRERSTDLGLRCVASAEEWLAAHAEALARAPDAEARLEAVGRRWGPGSASWLESWSDHSDDARALRWILQGAAE